jgi:hypothetical protein
MPLKIPFCRKCYSLALGCKWRVQGQNRTYAEAVCLEAPPRAVASKLEDLKRSDHVRSDAKEREREITTIQKGAFTFYSFFSHAMLYKRQAEPEVLDMTDMMNRRNEVLVEGATDGGHEADSFSLWACVWACGCGCRPNGGGVAIDARRAARLINGKRWRTGARHAARAGQQYPPWTAGRRME